MTFLASSYSQLSTALTIVFPFCGRFFRDMALNNPKTWNYFSKALSNRFIDPTTNPLS
mgnify:CR=1 FL=1